MAEKNHNSKDMWTSVSAITDADDYVLGSRTTVGERLYLSYTSGGYHYTREQ